ncbi:MAG TPA: FHA domain-containing protein [Ktedonobacterales bacterium]|nr:FHA domain-containing protein [Ktedonobacterales bacterium]
MAICSHCGKQSQGNEETCQFCGYPLTAAGDDISTADTVFTASPGTDGQNGAADASASENSGFGRVIVRPIQGAGETREYALTGQSVSIGRSPSCEIVLDQDQLTSRRHALLRYDGARYTVVDLGSSNGTFVNNSEIRDATPLTDGDRIIVGEHELLFSATAGADVSASAPQVDMNGAPPSSPLSVTGQQAAMRPEQQPVAVGAGEQTSGDEADTNYMATVVAPLEAASIGSADATNIADTADVADVAEVTDVSDVSDVADVSDVSDVSDVADVSETADTADAGAPPTDASDEAAQADVPLPPPSTPDSPSLLARAPSSGALRQPGGELDQLRAQLAQLAATSEAVAQHASLETDLSEQRRQALAETRDQLHAILAGIQNASSQQSAPESEETGDLTDLIALSQQAAADPNHLQNVSRLAEHAGDIARALEALQTRRAEPPKPAADEQALAELRALQARLDELA